VDVADFPAAVAVGLEQEDIVLVVVGADAAALGAKLAMMSSRRQLGMKRKASRRSAASGIQ